jgi:hypothetical protein
VQSKRKKLILSGDWNIDFMQESVKLSNLKNLLLMYNFYNIVMVPTRITENTKSLLDVIVINKDDHINQAVVLDLGYSDHQAQILHINVENLKKGPVRIKERQFTEESIEEFNYLLSKESWQELWLNTEVNTKFNIFMDSILYYYNIAFPLKSSYLKESSKNRWITKGIQISSTRMRFLNILRKTNNLPKKTQDYIFRYRVIYRRVIREAKIRENDRYVLNYYYH